MPPLREITPTQPGTKQRSTLSPPIAPNLIRSLGLMAPTVFGPMTRAPALSASCRSFITSCCGMFSVITTMSLMSFSRGLKHCIQDECWRNIDDRRIDLMLGARLSQRVVYRNPMTSSPFLPGVTPA